MDMQHGEMSPEKKMWMMKREHRAIHVLTMVIVGIFIFWCGFQLGEIRASIGPMRGFEEMNSGGWGGNVMYGTTRVQGMMTVPPSGAVPVPATNGQ